MMIEPYVRQDFLEVDAYTATIQIKKLLIEVPAVVVRENEIFCGILTTKDLIQNSKELVIDCLSDAITLNVEDTVEEALNLMNQRCVDTLPVFKHAEIFGLVFKNDLLKIVVENETRLKIKEEIQKLEKKNEMKDMILSVIGHDVKNCLSTLILISEVLDHHIVDFEQELSKKLIGDVGIQANLAYTMLDSLLLWARAQQGQTPFNPQPCKIDALINQEIKNLKLNFELKCISLNYICDSDVKVFADKNMVSAVLRNLISNAVKFTEKNGSIVISSHSVSGFIEVSVSDDGIGMSAGTRSELFKTNFMTPKLGTSNERGTGLGLSICKQFVEKNGGRIWVDEKLGKGSDFRFTLPKYRA